MSDTEQPKELHLERAVDVSAERIESVLRAQGPERWLPGYKHEGGKQTAELAYAQGGTRIVRRIEIETGPVQRFAYGVTVHVRWRAAERAELYPELDGHLRVEPRHPSGATIRFDARYVPPGGRIGATVDRAVMRHVAQASVSDFLDRVTQLLAGG